MIKRLTSFAQLERPDKIINDRLGSNPTLSAGKHSILDNLEDFSYPKNKVSHSFEAMDKPKYKRARLVHHGYDITKRWYVIFWAMDVSKDEYVRKRIYVNKKKTIQGRIRDADMLIKTVNAQLTAGKVLGKDNMPKNNNTNILKLSLLQAIDFVHDQKNLNKNRNTYTRRFKTLRWHLVNWLEFSKRSDFPLKQFDIEDALDFFNYVRDNVGSNKTFNNYRMDFAGCINFLMKRNPNLFDTNPIANIDTLPVTTKRHAAYSDKQIVAISAECKKLRFEYLLTFIQFIYFTLARPRELQALRVGDIQLDEKRILFRAEISKNKRDEFVGINDALMKVINAEKIMSYPKDYFVFGHDKPGSKAASKLYYYRRMVKVLKSLGYDSLLADHDLYSFKHSGAVSLYRATKDIKLVQSQCRHASVAQSDAYLRDLGLMDNFDSLEKWQGAF